MQYSYANQNVSEEFYLYVPQMVLIDIGQTPGDFFFFFFFKKNLYHTRFSLANSQNKDFGLTLEIIITVHFFLFYPFLTSQLC